MISEMISQERIQEEQRVIYTQVHSQKIKELKLKAHLAKLIRTYVEVLVWFSDAGLLPELPPAPGPAEEEVEDNADYPINPFPVAAMVSNYNDIRQAIRQKLLELNFEEEGGQGLATNSIFSVSFL